MYLCKFEDCCGSIPSSKKMGPRLVGICAALEDKSLETSRFRGLALGTKFGTRKNKNGLNGARLMLQILHDGVVRRLKPLYCVSTS